MSYLCNRNKKKQQTKHRRQRISGNKIMKTFIANHFEDYVNEFKKKCHGQKVLSIEFNACGIDERIARIWMTYSQTKIPEFIAKDIMEECDAYQRAFSIKEDVGFVYIEIK